MDPNNPETEWNYDAPQFYDFKKILHGLDESFNEDSYFGTSHEKLAIPPTSEVPAEKEAEIGDYDESSSEEMENIEAKTYYNAIDNSKPMDLLANLPEFNNKSQAYDSPDKGKMILRDNSARKRTSMSVDRGKFRVMQHSKIPMVTDLIHHLPSTNRKLLRFVLDKENRPPIAEEHYEGDAVKTIENKPSEQRGIPTTYTMGHISKKDMLTTFKPFSFEERYRQLRDRKEKSARNDEKKLNEAFKAKKATVLTKAPFIPQKQTRSNINILPTMFKLKTQERAEHRAEAERIKKLKEEEDAKLLKDRERQKLIDEEESIRRERAKTVIKAQPVRHYRSIDPLNAAQPTSTRVRRAHSLVAHKN